MRDHISYIKRNKCYPSLSSYYIWPYLTGNISSDVSIF